MSAGVVLLGAGFAGEAGAAAITAVSVSGTATIPDVLTAVVAGGPASSYQWYDCTGSISATVTATSSWTGAGAAGCTGIGGATSSTYTLQGTDYGSTVTVAASESGGPTTGVAASVLVTEPAPSAVASPTLAVTNSPAYAGDAATYSGSTFTTAYNFTTSYQWYDCSAQVATASNATTVPAGCAAIGGATTSSYGLAVSDVGSFILLRETETNAAGSATVFSASTATAVQGAAPANTVSPLIGAQTAFTVSVTSHGTWTGHPAPTSYTVTWYRCGTTHVAGSVLPGGCTAIAGSATTTSDGLVTYTFVAADQNTYILAGVAANNGITSANTAYSATSALVTGVAPAVSTPPAVTGTDTVGQTLTLSTGTWTGLPQPTAFTYAWLSCTSNPVWTGAGSSSASLPSALSSCSVIGGAAATTYSLANAQSGDYIVGEVSTSNGVGSFYFWTAPTAQVAGPTTPTSISASISAGNVNGTFTGTFGDSGGSPAPSLTYRWLDCSTVVAGSGSSPESSSQAATALASCSTAHNTSTGTTYTVLSSDVTSASSGGLVVELTATNTAGSVYAWSDATAIANAAPTSGLVVETGSGALSSTLTDTATWSAIPAPSITYAWLDCPSSGYTGLCTTIAGATGSTYTPSSLTEAALNGGTDYVLAAATATNGSGSSGPIYGTGKLLTTQAPSNVVAPSVPATASTSTALLASNGTWQGAPSPTFTYQWYVCTSVVASSGSSVPSGCSAISGATSGSYLPSSAYAGDYFLVAVTGSNGVLHSGASTAVTVYSASTTSALVATISITTLTITGTAAVGGTLTANAAVTATGTYTVTYQWYACTVAVVQGTTVPGTCAAIAGATSSTFAPTATEVGKYLTVAVVASQTGASATEVAASTALVTTSAPGAPTSVVAVAGVGSVTLTWVAPTTGLAVVTYTATSSTGGFTCTVATTTCVVTGPLFGTLYSFTVTGTNAAGTGPASVASNSVMPTEAVPAAPTAVSGAAGNGSVVVSWTAGANNGAVISLYTVTSSPSGGSCTSATTTCTVNGLTNGTAYTFTVTATNAVGTGLASAASSAAAPRTVPSTPTVSSAKTNHRGSLLVTWSAATANGTPVTGYLVTATGTNGPKTCTSTGLSCTVSGLTPGASYTLSVVAESVAGNSSASTGLNAKVAKGATAPRIVSHSATATTIVLHLAKPSSNGGATVTTYQYYVSGKGWRTASSKTGGTLTIKGLKAGATYTVAVRSVNVTGPGPRGPFIKIRTA